MAETDVQSAPIESKDKKIKYIDKRISMFFSSYNVLLQKAVKFLYYELFSNFPIFPLHYHQRIKAKQTNQH